MATLNEQLQAMRGLAENWDGYGAAASQAGVIDVAQELAGLIEAMLEKGNTGLCLHVSPTRIGGVLIEWQDGSMQHEVEIHPDRSLGFLHLDKATGQIETRKFSPGALHPGVLQELRLLVAA